MSTTRHPRTDWYREWFGEEYLALYPHRNVEEARAAVRLVLSVYDQPDGPVLDLACGAGRHLQEFEAHGVYTVGLDLSWPLLLRARRGTESPTLVQGDMRDLPLADGSFALVVNFFTSFGYFSDPEEDRQVLSEIRRVLRSGGGFALDFLNAPRVRSNLVARDERRIGDRRILQERQLEEGGTVVSKVIRILEPDAEDASETYHERVRLYEPEQLRHMLAQADFTTEHVYGDYSGVPLQADSPRCILMGRAT